VTLTDVQMKQKMAKSVARKSPGSTLVPPGIGSTPAEVKPQPEPNSAPAISDLVSDQADVMTVNELAVHYKSNAEIESKAKKAKEEYGKRIKFILGNYGIQAVQCNDYRVTISHTQYKIIDPVKLLAAGVTEDVILACTNVTVSNTIHVTNTKKGS
jgi:hypothetical protein